MLGFPQKTELRKPLHKKAIFDRLKLNKAQQDRVDADISRLWFVNEISPFSVGIAAGEEVKAFFVILVSLKSKEYDDKTIAMLLQTSSPYCVPKRTKRNPQQTHKPSKRT